MEQADFSAGKGESAMGQNYFRIDDRLIHGQIVTAWCSHLNIQEIIAIDDTLAGNSMLQSIMLMGVPKQYKSCVVTMAQAKELFAQPSDCNRLFVTRFPQDLTHFREELKRCEIVIIGNAAKRHGAKFNLTKGGGKKSMNTLQVILIALFIYLGAIGSIVGNTLGWYCVGRPLIAAFVVGLIMGDMSTAMLVGIPLQIAYLANVTPGGAVSWDLSYATYIGTAMAIALKGTVGDEAALVGLAFTGAGVGGMVGGTMWNVHYALDVFVNRWANKIAESGETKKRWMPNIIGGQIIGFLCRFVPAVIVLTAIRVAGDAGGIAIPAWFTTGISAFGSMMAALGMGIILSFLVKKGVHWAIFLGGFVLVTYFGLSTMAVAVVAAIIAVISYFIMSNSREEVA